MKRKLGVIIGVAVVIIVAFMFLSPPEQQQHKHAIRPALILHQIKVKKESERFGDELYVTLNARIGGKFPEYIRIPAKPDHWLSRQIDLVKDVKLWSDSIAEGASAIIIIELNEQDAEPLIPDDLLGVMRVKLKNEKGSLKVDWDIPNLTGVNVPKKVSGQLPDTTEKESSQIQKFDLNNEGGSYEVYLSVKK